MKHLIYYGPTLFDMDYDLIEIDTWQYLKNRLRFWKWYKQNTMGRSILMLRRYKGNT